MKLLFDENLSDRIVPAILELFPDSTHVKTEGLMRTMDSDIWEFAKQRGFVIISKDADFHQRSLLLGHPPKLVFLKTGNCPTAEIVFLIRSHHSTIEAFGRDAEGSILILNR